MNAKPMRTLRRTFVAAAMLLCQFNANAELPVETLGVVESISAKTRVFVPDIAINNIADGKLHVVDGDTGNYLGVIGTGFAGQVKLSHDGNEIYVSTSYYSRGQRGTKTSIVEVWDAHTLKFKHEIRISDKRAMALNYKWLTSLSSDGRWLFVQNATPATSVTVVDLAARKTVSEIDMPGCYAIYPVKSQPNRFGSLCGDGKVEMITLNRDGRVSGRTVSDVLFDPDNDALFIQAEATGDTYHFVSFTGNIVSIDMSGGKAAGAGKWSMVNAEQRAHGWRPGGYQPLALDAASGRLFVTMHEGGKEGSHKLPAKEIWGFDMRSKQRVMTLPGNDSTAISTSADGSKLFAINALKAALVITELGAQPKEVGSFPIGTFPSQIESN